MLDLQSIDSSKVDNYFAGRVSLEDSLLIQERILALRKVGQINDMLLFFELADCYTTGRLTRYAIDRELDIKVLDRGGGPTFHGPGQLVCYPIASITSDLRAYSRWLENLIIRTLSGIGLVCSSIDGLTGVWVEDRKIAFIGAKNSMGYTKHGFSVNLTCDTRKFDKIVACGIENLKVTSLLEETGVSMTPKEFSLEIIRSLNAGD